MARKPYAFRLDEALMERLDRWATGLKLTRTAALEAAIERLFTPATAAQEADDGEGPYVPDRQELRELRYTKCPHCDEGFFPDQAVQLENGMLCHAECTDG